MALTGCTFQGNAVNRGTGGITGYGGGVGIEAGSAALTACTFTGNAATGGGGVFNGTGNVVLMDCTFRANVASSGTLAGSGGGLDGNGGGPLALTGCKFIGNESDFGGGLYVLNGSSATVQDCTFSGNHASRGGSGVCCEETGAVALTGCAFAGNVTTSGDGGGVLNDSTVTLTSCTLSGNTASNGTGGAIANGFYSGPATLTDDVLYGDGSPVSGGGELGETGFSRKFSVAYCDIDSGATDPVNHVFSAEPLFVRNPGTNGATDYGDLHLQATSPVIGAGTDSAPGFLSTDLDGKPYFTPPALGAYEGPEDAHVLWDNPDGRTIFWDTNAQGSHIIAGNYDPLTDPSGNTGYVARSLSTGPNGVSHALWSALGGRLCLGSVTPAGALSPLFYGPFSDDGTSRTIWQPVAVSTGGDNVTHVLWTNPDGRTILWDVNTDGGFAVVGNYAGFSDDGTAKTVWKAFALASGPDGLSHVLWNNPDGRTLLWDLDAQDRPTPHVYPAFSDDGTASTIWQARALSVGPDDVPHLLWGNPNGRTILWNVAADGSFGILGDYAGFSDDGTAGTVWRARGLATGSDGLLRILWNNPDSHTLLWDVAGRARPVSFGYGLFSDDGTPSTLWQAVAVSAGP